MNACSQLGLFMNDKQINIDVALSVEDALSLIKNKKYDLAVCDIGLPLKTNYKKISYQEEKKEAQKIMKEFVKKSSTILNLSLEEYLKAQDVLEGVLSYFFPIKDKYSIWEYEEMEKGTYLNPDEVFGVVGSEEKIKKAALKIEKTGALEVFAKESFGVLLSKKMKKIGIPVVGYTNSKCHGKIALLKGVMGDHLSIKALVFYLIKNGTPNNENLTIIENLFYGPKDSISDIANVVKKAKAWI